MRRIAIALDSRRGRRRAARLRGGRADEPGHRDRRRRRHAPSQIQLITNDSNPKAGTCTLIQAIVTLNGTAVPDGTSVNFSTDFGTFSQNGQPLVSVVTQNGVAVTALCGPGAGLAKVHATATVDRQHRLGQPRRSSSSPRRRTLPFVSSCSPSFGPKEGGTTLTLNGGRFFGSAVDDPGAVHGQRHRPRTASSSRSRRTRSWSRRRASRSSPPRSCSAQITLSLGTNSAQPDVLSLPSVLLLRHVGRPAQPTITSLLPPRAARARAARG